MTDKILNLYSLLFADSSGDHFTIKVDADSPEAAEMCGHAIEIGCNNSQDRAKIRLVRVIEVVL